MGANALPLGFLTLHLTQVVLCPREAGQGFAAEPIDLSLAASKPSLALGEPAAHILLPSKSNLFHGGASIIERVQSCLICSA